MKKNTSDFAIVVHGGAGSDSPFIRKNKKGYEDGLKKAIEAGYEILKQNGKAVDAVEAAIKVLENNTLFNAGRGSAINAKGEIEMDACIMDGASKKSGAVTIIKNVKNPISVAKAVMLNTNYKYLGAHGALDFAKKKNIELEPDSYFITEHQFDEYTKKRKEAYDSNREVAEEEINQRIHGTVGAVALDCEGNIAAGTSTGGSPYCKEGRISDSSIVGVGTFANNKTCAISCTGDGEYLMEGVIANSISAVMAYKHKSVAAACKEVIKVENKGIEGDMGVIAIDTKGNIAMEFNCDRMHRAWKKGNEKTITKIYKD
jgi:beta-aspartyl-peptidase (threonine type)